VCLAARVAKFGISFEDALWRVPLAVINQLIVYDEMQEGRQTKWAVGGGMSADDIGRYMEAALTGVRR